ncbi:MAG: Branched-chain amino acid transport system permease protein LivM, partial [uncultured Solirubrobacteraceae bacterium]
RGGTPRPGRERIGLRDPARLDPARRHRRRAHGLAGDPRARDLLPHAHAGHRRDPLPVRRDGRGPDGRLQRPLRHPVRPGARHGDHRSRARVLVRPARLRRRLPRPAGPDPLAVRARAARHPRQRGADARAGLRDLPLQVRGVLRRGRRRGARRGAPGLPAAPGDHERCRLRDRGAGARRGGHRRGRLAVGPVRGGGDRRHRARRARAVARRARAAAARRRLPAGGLPPARGDRRAAREGPPHAGARV